MNLYGEELNRMQKRAAGHGEMVEYMMKWASSTGKGMQDMTIRIIQGIIEYSPMATILKCMNCDAVLFNLLACAK